MHHTWLLYHIWTKSPQSSLRYHNKHSKFMKKWAQLLKFGTEQNYIVYASAAHSTWSWYQIWRKSIEPSWKNVQEQMGRQTGPIPIFPNDWTLKPLKHKCVEMPNVIDCLMLYHKTFIPNTHCYSDLLPHVRRWGETATWCHERKSWQRSCRTPVSVHCSMQDTFLYPWAGWFWGVCSSTSVPFPWVCDHRSCIWCSQEACRRSILLVLPQYPPPLWSASEAPHTATHKSNII